MWRPTMIINSIFISQFQLLEQKKTINTEYGEFHL